MITYKISNTEVKAKAAKVTQALCMVDSFVLTHYRQPVGYITPKVPKELLKKAGVKEREGFREVK